MSYYKVLSCKDNKLYNIESIFGGAQREMRVQYADLVRIKESSCQIIDSLCPASYSTVSPELFFVEDRFGKIHPLEAKLYHITQKEEIRQNHIIEVKLRNESAIDLYVVVSISKPEKEPQGNISKATPELTLQKFSSHTSIKTTFDDIDVTTLKLLEDSCTCLTHDTLVVMDQSGIYYKYDAVSKPISYDTRFENGSIINIASKETFTLAEISKELGTKIQDVKIALRNVLPNGKNMGTGIDSNYIALRKNRQGLANEQDDNNVSITSSEFYRLIQYIKRPDTQSKSIIHWKFYVNKKYSSIQPPTYLDYQHNPYKDEIPYQHLDMDRFENLINWLIGKVSLMGDIETYFPYFHLLYWSEQISFVQKIIVLHRNGSHKLNNLEILETLVKYPKFVNINVLIFIHSLLKLNKERKLLSNLELYNIWRAYCPSKNRGKIGLTLQEYIGTNLFCTCKGAIGFNVEDWWQPNINDDNKPIFHVYNGGEISLHYYNKHFTQDISPTMEDAKKHRSFVVFREDYAKASSCFESFERKCPVLDAIYNDTEYRDDLLSSLPSSNITRTEDGEENEIYNVDLSFNDCPLISAPSWRYIWAERHRESCTLMNPPKIKALYLWYNKNRKLKTPFFCEGRLAIDRNNGDPELHRFARVNFNWCNGNTCFTDIYVLPSTNTQQDLELSVNIYNSAIYFNFFSVNDSKAKLEMQNFNSSLNWLNNAAPHLYCGSCDRILEIRNSQPHNNAHTVTWFECQNDECDKVREQIYISHCWNDRCRSIIDSRETTTCPNRKFICPSCGVCCGYKMFKYKRQAGLSHGPAWHFESNKFYCRKCGKQMTRQGNSYYCSDHPDVTTRVYK
jgi:hypothetical protein